MILEFSKAEDVIKAHNKAIEELRPLVGEAVEGDFYKAVSYIGDSFVRKLMEQDEEFDLLTYINNVVYTAMKTGYYLCEGQSMQIQ